MVHIGETYFHIDVSNLDDEALKSYATSLFHDFDDSAMELLPFQDYEIHLDVEEGSIKGRGTIFAAVGVLYLGVGNFGSFVQGVREISALVKTVGENLIDSAPKKLNLPPEKVTWRRNDSAKLGQLERLFENVRSGVLKPHEATEQAIALLGEVIPPIKSGLQK